MQLTLLSCNSSLTEKAASQIKIGDYPLSIVPALFDFRLAI